MYATATHKEIHMGTNAMTPETETVPYIELLPVVPYFPLSVHKLLLSLPKQPFLRYYSNS